MEDTVTCMPSDFARLTLSNNQAIYVRKIDIVAVKKIPHDYPAFLGQINDDLKEETGFATEVYVTGSPDAWVVKEDVEVVLNLL